ncbi:hypothetical protein [Tenacibaculum jejuense]|uniref:Putative conserved membrane exported protein n=1 Tax=Tenacibaculum jejuense TaxID=584609 RepID=A0A238UDY0_9FLAO|nr:hypothetical protein [Tenacibaculum jejuense]SNR17389.1 putative conserved membrane exported protein [Tenacibaculum jejuense]
MKNLLLYIVLLLSIQAISQTGPVQAEVDTTNIRIGEQFQYKLSIDGTENVIIPRLELNGLEMVDSLKLDTLKNKLVQKYILTGFDSGSFYIPRQQIFIRNQTFFTDSLLINVATVPVDTTQVKMFAIKGIKSEPLRFSDYKHIIFWILAILLLVGSILYFALKRTNDDEIQTSEQLLSPYQEALKNLKVLDGKLLWQNNQIKEHYSELTHIIRNFIERELHVPALETTSDGLIESLTDFKDSNSIIAEKETIDKLNGLLKQADLVKFAKSKPLAHEIEADRNIAKYVIDNLKPNSVDTETTEVDLEPVIIVEKPIVKKPSILVKIITIAVLLLIVTAIIYSVSKTAPELNSLKPKVTNVQ